MRDDPLKSTGRQVLAGLDWRGRLAAIGAQSGSYERLGADHAALFTAGSETLLVTFESRDTILRDRADQLPFGREVAQQNGWSHLCLIADQDTWFRSEEVIAYFDDLVEASVFDEFDRVIFYGAGMCGYAAAAFSVTAPGATVVLVQPQATLDPRIAGWDHRFFEKRRFDFTARYGFAPDMTEGADHVFVLFDPDVSLDAMHAALFARSWSTLLPCRRLGRDVAGALQDMQITPAILKAVASGTFDARLFATFFRVRRNYQPYLSTILTRLDRDGRLILSGILCRSLAERLNLGKFRARLAEIEDELARNGERLPDRN
jgi:hypothetical protein